MPDLPILFVDDDPEILRALCRAVQSCGFSIVTAKNGRDGLAAMAEQEFAVIVSDFRMPGMDGVEFLSAARARWPHSERFLLTAFADEAALERGINDVAITRFLRKPWQNAVLVEVLQRAVESTRLRHENVLLEQRLRNRNAELSYLNGRLAEGIEERERRLLSFRRRWDVALNAISDAIVVIGPDFRIEGSNLAAAALGKTTVEDLEGRRCHEALFGRAAPCEGCPLDVGGSRLASSGAGGTTVFDARAYSLPDAATSHLCIYRDITHAVTFEAEAAQMQKMALIGALAGGVAHEINNPLQGILSFAQLARKPGVTPDKLARFLEFIEESALRCRDIVQSMRDFSRAPRAGEHAEIGLGEALRKALLLFAAREDAHVVLKALPSDARCHANPNKLQQVVVNLVQNALDASPQGGRVEVSVTVSGAQVILAVEDQGPGVPTELREKIFEPFFTTKPPGVGTGFGLSISRSIMQEHGGTLTVETAALGGARFEARLPAAHAKGER